MLTPQSAGTFQPQPTTNRWLPIASNFRSRLTTVKVRVMKRPKISRPVCLGVKPPSGAQDQICIAFRQLRVSWFGAPSLTRRICRLNCSWSSPAQSLSGPSPAGLITILYCLRFKTPPTWRARSPCLYSPGTAWSSYTPRHCVPFSLTPRTSRATIEVFDPAIQCQSYFTTGGFPSISSSWRQAPRYSRPEIFFHLNHCGNSPYVTSSFTRRMCLSLVNMLGLCKMYFSRV
jgi:hypothetical protein